MKLVCNVGGIERVVRIIGGVVLIGLSYFGVLPAVAPMVIGYIVGIAALVTGAISYCPISAFLGVNTCAKAGKEKLAA